MATICGGPRPRPDPFLPCCLLLQLPSWVRYSAANLQDSSVRVSPHMSHVTSGWFAERDLHDKDVMSVGHSTLYSKITRSWKLSQQAYHIWSDSLVKESMIERKALFGTTLCTQHRTMQKPTTSQSMSLHLEPTWHQSAYVYVYIYIYISIEVCIRK